MPTVGQGKKETGGSDQVRFGHRKKTRKTAKLEIINTKQKQMKLIN